MADSKRAMRYGTYVELSLPNAHFYTHLYDTYPTYEHV